MKKATIGAMLVACISAGVLLGLKTTHLFNQQNYNGQKILSEQTTAPSPSPTPGIPKRLVIPSIGVDAVVEEVGLDKENRMDVPKLAENVAWYNLGSRPGKLGNAVINGHLDKVTGDPAVFFKLPTVKVGDEISTTDNLEKSYVYTVSAVETYPYNQVPLQRIFGSSDGNHLNLITCEGAYNDKTKNYSLRVVVYSDLQEPTI